MNIGIIGSGNMGSGLGKIWARKGHNIIFSYSRDRAKLDSLAGSVANARAGSAAEAVQMSEIVLFSVPWASVEDAARAAGPMDGKIVIDCTNPLTRDADDLLVGHTTSGGELIANILPGAKVVKAFNTAFAQIYHSETRLFGSRHATMFYCGDDADAKATAAKLINDAGFAPIDSGPLKCARYLEPLAMLMIQLGYGQGMGTDIALNLIHR